MTPEQKLRIFDTITKQSLELICTIDQCGYLTYISDACLDLLGYESEELIGRKIPGFLLPEDFTADSSKVYENPVEGFKVHNITGACLHKAGHKVQLLWSGAWSEEDQAYICVARPVTGKVLARETLHKKDEQYRALVEHSADVNKMLDEKGNFLYSSGSALYEFGYTPETLVGKSAFSFIHPDDSDKVKTFLSALLSGKDYVNIPAFRFKTADGNWRWIEATLSNQLQNPNVGAIISSSRDITEYVENKHKLQESEQLYRSLFENQVDAAVLQNQQGFIIDANPAMLDLLGVQKDEVVNKHLSDFLPKDVISVCQDTLQDALCGKPIRYDIPIFFENKGSFIFDITKIPVKVNEETIGVYSIFRDLTDIEDSRRTIEVQANKLNSILESIADAFFTLDKNWQFNYVNSVFANYKGYSREEMVGKNIWQLFPKLVSSAFYSKCYEVIESGHACHFEENFSYSGSAFSFNIYPSEDGLSIYFIDITELQKSREELEKLSLVASRTTNGVIITNKDHLIEWVNAGFTKMTGYSLAEAYGRLPRTLLYHEQANFEILDSVSEQMVQGKPAAFEILNKKKNGEDLWLSVEVNPVLDEFGEVVRFVIIQTDITALKKSELSLSELTADLFRQNRDLQQFAYIVSHNLRAPVANVLGLSNILALADKNTLVYDTALNNLRESANQLDSVVRDVNTILSIRDSKHTLEREQVKLAEVFQQAYLNLQDLLEQCGGKLTVDINENLRVYANKAYLHSIFYNLLSNAIKYRSEDRTLNVQVECNKSAEEGVIITISDNGSGFDIHNAGNKLFKLYQRFHPDKKGRGIGLYLVKTHLEAMEGRIEVNSQVNVGTTFTIYLN